MSILWDPEGAAPTKFGYFGGSDGVPGLIDIDTPS